MPPPTMITSKSVLRGAAISATPASGTPRASRGTRSAAPMLSRASADFAGGKMSKASRPTLRRLRITPSGVAKIRTRPSVNCTMRRRSVSRHAAYSCRTPRGTGIVEPGMAVIGNHLGQAHGIAQPQVETLARDRVQALGGRADHGDARCRVALGARQGQVVCDPLADAQETAEPEAERGLELAEEFLVAQRQQARDLGRFACPHHAAAAIGERQHRDRTVLGEPLVGDVVVEALGDEHRRDRRLLVLDVLRTDAGLVPDDRTDAVGRHDQPGTQRLRLACELVVHVAPAVGEVAPHDARRGNDADGRLTRQPVPERCADRAVRHDVTERLEPLLGGVDPGRTEPTLFGDVDPADRRSLALHARPHAERAKRPDRAVGERGRAFIEARMLVARAGRDRLEQRDPEPQRRERECERRADQPATDDGEVEFGLRLVHRVSVRPRPSRVRSRPACAAARTSAGRNRSP